MHKLFFLKHTYLPLVLLLVFFALTIDAYAQEEKTGERTAEQIKQWEAGVAAYNEGDFEKAIDNWTKFHGSLPADSPDHATMLAHLADTCFMFGDASTAVTYYDQLIELSPEIAPHLWQRGLALYYAEQYEEGQKQFETHQSVNTQDVENAVWHQLCLAKVSGVEAAREKLIPIQDDDRVPMSEINDLFAGNGNVAAVIKAASESTGSEERIQAQLYYAHLYIGLWHEMNGRKDESIESMKKAVEVNPLPPTLFMANVAAVHLKLRE